MTFLSPWHEIKFNFKGIFFAEHVYLVNYKRYLDNFHAHCVNNILPFLTILRLEVQFVVFLCKIQETRVSIVIPHFAPGNNWNVVLIAIHRILADIEFAALFTLAITNFTLIGYYLHYVNSSPLNWKQYRFVSEETKQKIGLRLFRLKFGDTLIQIYTHTHG